MVQRNAQYRGCRERYWQVGTGRRGAREGSGSAGRAPRHGATAMRETRLTLPSMRSMTRAVCYGDLGPICRLLRTSHVCISLMVPTCFMHPGG